jgi:CDK-activating kinase assembly factor MAT1
MEKPDQCPVCKGDQLTNPDMRFKINTKCYHRICESCIDRHYKDSGAKNCPVYSCDKVLWKREWRKQTFEDLKVEREVEIRKRVERILHRDEAEFQDIRAYNDYLELRETLAMNLVLNTDVNATNRKLRDYQRANGIKVDKNVDDGKSKPNLKKSQVNGAADPSGLISGLRKIEAPPPIPEYNPFQGVPVGYDYITLKEEYQEFWRASAQTAKWTAGGYNFMVSSLPMHDGGLPS